MIQAGYIQFAPVLGDPRKNIQCIGELLEGVTADLLVLPELANSGYNFTTADEAALYSEEISRSCFTDFIFSIARERNMYIVTGFCERSGNKIYNTSVLAGPKGLVGKYRKLHLFMDEKDYFSPGDLGLPVFHTEIGVIGMLICFDWAFPEAWRILALQDSEIIAHPSNLVLPFAQRVVPVHALINRVNTITCNRTGTERDLRFTGQSFISDTLGNVVLMASGDMAEVGITSIDPETAKNKMSTSRNHLFEDRRPELYQLLSCKI